MEVKNRIIKIMENSGLTPSEFADKIEVQRSAISHITSGRNKPSLEFLIKIKQAFPEIDSEWLVFGMEKETNSEEIASESKPSEYLDHSFPTLLDLFEKEEKQENSVEKPSPSELISTVTHSKKILRVVVFYEDNTFEDFVHSNSKV